MCNVDRLIEDNEVITLEGEPQIRCVLCTRPVMRSGISVFMTKRAVC